MSQVYFCLIIHIYLFRSLVVKKQTAVRASTFEELAQIMIKYSQ